MPCKLFFKTAIQDYSYNLSKLYKQMIYNLTYVIILIVTSQFSYLLEWFKM